MGDDEDGRETREARGHRLKRDLRLDRFGEGVSLAPVILTTQVEREQWLSAPTAEALALQRPDGALRIVARGDKQDGSA